MEEFQFQRMHEDVLLKAAQTTSWIHCGQLSFCRFFDEALKSDVEEHIYNS